MTTPTEQPEALNWADRLEAADKRYCMPMLHRAATELRRLHAENEALRERADFLTGMTREAQQFAQIYGDQVIELQADALRYREFCTTWPICFLGVDHHDKASLDAAIDTMKGQL